MIAKRGFNCQEAMAYLGIKRKTFDKYFRPYLSPVRMGTSLIFDKLDLDRVWEEYKSRNGRPIMKGGAPWAVQQCPAFTVTKQETGVLTSFTKGRGFASASARILAKRKAG